MERGIRIVLIGGKASSRTYAAQILKRYFKFKHMRISQGVDKIIRTFYMYGTLKQKIRWEKRIHIYDALYKIDNDIHINYLVRLLDTTTRDVVIDDVRYINELLELQKHDFVIVRVEVPQKGYRHVGRTVLDAAGGTLAVSETFGRAGQLPYKADYSIYLENKETLQRDLQRILDLIRESRV